MSLEQGIFTHDTLRVWVDSPLTPALSPLRGEGVAFNARGTPQLAAAFVSLLTDQSEQPERIGRGEGRCSGRNHSSRPLSPQRGEGRGEG